MSSSNTSLAAAVSVVKQSMITFVEVYSITLFILGVIGHALNIYVFTHPKFRTNPCARYFLASAFSGYAIVCVTIPLRLLQTRYNIDVFISSIPMCKILTYALACFRILPSWIIALASIDRFLCSSSSVRLRSWSTVRVAYGAIFITALFIALANIHLAFSYTILLPQRSCSYASSNDQTFVALWNLCFSSWIPTACVLIFGLLIIRHIRQGKRRIAPQNQLPQNQKKTDRQLLQMLLIQCLVVGSTALVSIGNLYISITNYLWVKNDLDKAKDAYILNALSNISLSGPCLNFYIFTLSSQLFRHELIKLYRWRRPVTVVNNTNRSIKQRVLT